jgi:predicted dehydrogenase
VKLNVLIIGNGHYVSGLTPLGDALRSDKNHGVWLPCALALRHEGLVDRIVLSATDGDKLALAKGRAESLAARYGWDAALSTVPGEGQRDDQAYLRAIESIEKPAVAWIAVPDDLHATVMEACIRAGLPLLVVKPAVTRREELDRIAGLLDEHRGFGMVDYHKVYDEANLMLREAIRGGELGALQHVHSLQTQRRAMLGIYERWLRANPALNVNHYLGSHYIHLTHFMTGARPVDVRAIAHHGHAREKPGAPVADLITTQIRWKGTDGAPFTSYHVAGWADPDETTAMTYQRIEVIGSAGRITSDQRDRGFRRVVAGTGEEVPNPYFFRLTEGLGGSPDLSAQYGYRSVRTFLRRASEVLAGSRSPGDFDDTLPTIRQSAVTTTILETADRSLERDGEVVVVRG